MLLETVWFSAAVYGLYRGNKAMEAQDAEAQAEVDAIACEDEQFRQDAHEVLTHVWENYDVPRVTVVDEESGKTITGVLHEYFLDSDMIVICTAKHPKRRKKSDFVAVHLGQCSSVEIDE